MNVQERRRAMLDHIVADHYSPDPTAWEGCDDPLGRWLTVTDDGRGDKWLNCHATEADAFRDFENQLSDEYPWVPWVLVDLDSGTAYDVELKISRGATMVETFSVPGDD